MSRLVYCVVALILVVGLAGSPPLAAKGVDAAVMAGVSPDITSFFDDGGILVGWDTPKDVKHGEVIEYHIWRDSVYGSAPIMALDSALLLAFMDFDHGAVDTTGFRMITYQFASPDHQELVSAETTAPGITIGRAHRYWISCLYRRRHAHEFTYWETAPVYAGQATRVRRPEPDAPGGIVTADYVDLTSVTFRWRGSGGADQYVIEISPTPDFRRDETWVDVIYQPTSTDLQLFSKTYTNVLKDASTGEIVPELASVSPGGTLYWRVGARNSEDIPGPIPAGPSPQLDGPKNTRYIYCDMSQYFSFLTLPDGPPPPPDDGGDDDGGDVPPPPPPPPIWGSKR